MVSLRPVQSASAGHRPRGVRGRVALAATLLFSSLGLQACFGPDEAVVAFLLASEQAERWTSVDEPVFAERLEEVCDGCSYLTYNAGQSAETQAEQFEQAIDDGADVVVLNAVDAERAAELVSDTDVPVIAYDRFVEGAARYVAADPGATGRVMASTLVRAVGKGSRALFISGARGDENATEITREAEAVLRENDVEVIDTLTPSSWSKDAAKKFVLDNRDRIGEVDAVFASNDTQAAGVVEALRELKVSDWPFVTGQDAELSAVRRVVVGTQGMTVYKQIRTLAERAADMAVDLMADEQTEGLTDHRGVPSVILEPAAVTRTTVAGTVVRDGVYTIEQICEGETARACTKLGLY